MQAAAFSFRRRVLAAAIHRTVGVSWQIRPKFTADSFTFCSQVTRDYFGLEDTVPDAADGPNCLSIRIERLPRGEPVGFAFQRWMGEGFPVHRGDIFHAINRLRKLKLNKRALEVMEWVIREKPYKPKELDYSYLLEFTVKLHGISQGEKLFGNVPVEFQKDLLFNNLVIACLDKGVIRLSMDYMKKMRELGHPISHLVFNRLIILHSSPSHRKIIPNILRQMKADKVSPHVSTYNILLKIEASEYSIDGLMRIFGNMNKANVEPNEITYCIVATSYAVARLYTVCEEYVECIKKTMTANNWSTYDVLMILYGYLGKVRSLEETWGIIRDFPHVRPKSFLLAIEAFGRAGKVNRAEAIWLELKTEKGLKLTEQFNSMISVYCRHGYVDKVSSIFKEMKANDCKPNAITFRHLALGCLRSGLVKEALKTIEMGSKQIITNRVKKSAPWLETTLGLVDGFAEIGDVESAEKLFEELKKANYTRYTFVYNSLIKAYVKAKVYCPNLLSRVILGGARPDNKTYSLVKLVDQFKESQ